MKENKTKKENKIPNKNKKLKVISIILILLLIILGVVSFAYSQNIKLAKNNNEEQEVEESKTQEIVLEDNKYMHVEIDASGEQVPVPNGFVGSKATGENEIDSGFVIYEGEEEVTDNNVADAQKIRNQYVWYQYQTQVNFMEQMQMERNGGRIIILQQEQVLIPLLMM